MQDTYNESTMNGNGNDPRDPHVEVHNYNGTTRREAQDQYIIVTEKNIPIPPVMCGRKSSRKRSDIEVAFMHMELGDSIYIPEHLVNAAKSALNVFARLKATKKQSRGAKYQFVTRRVERKNPAFRVWRVK